MTIMNSGKREQLTTNQTTGAKCAVCQKNKFQLRSKKSKLNGQTMLVCNTCVENKYEPRWLIIIIAQDEGVEAVQDYILRRRYVGNEIQAADLIK